MPRLRKGRIAILIVFVIVAVLSLLYVYRSGRLTSFGFWVAVSQFVLLILGVATALFNEWVSKNRVLTLAVFIVFGLAGLLITVKQSDQNAAESKELEGRLVGKLNQIEQLVLQGNPLDRNQIIAEIQSAREAITSSSPLPASASASMPFPSATLSPASPPASPPPVLTKSSTYHEQFLNHGSMLTIPAEAQRWHQPPGEPAILIKFRLVFQSELHNRHKRVIVYIPATRDTESAFKYVGTDPQRWMQEIEKNLAGNAEFESLRYYPLLGMIIYHESPLWRNMAEALEKQGHKLHGPPPSPSWIR